MTIDSSHGGASARTNLPVPRRVSEVRKAAPPRALARRAPAGGRIERRGMRGHCGQQAGIGEHAGTEDRVVASRAIRHRRPGYREEQSRGPADHAARQGFWVAHGAEAPNVCRLPRPEGRHASHERAAAAPEQRDIPEPAQCLTGTGRRAQRRVVGSRVGGHGCREHGHQERLGDPTDAMRSWGGRPRERGVARRQGGIRKAWGVGGARHTGTLVALLFVGAPPGAIFWPRPGAARRTQTTPE